MISLTEANPVKKNKEAENAKVRVMKESFFITQ